MREPSLCVCNANLCDRNLEAAYDVLAKQRLEPRANHAGGALHLSLPRRVFRLYVQHTAFQLDRRHPADRGTNRRTPGEGDLLWRQRRLAQDEGERLGHDLMHRDHVSEDSIDACG